MIQLKLLPSLLFLSSAVGLYNLTGTRSDRQFSLFSIVQFGNNACTAFSDASINGTCFTSSECTSAGGSADGHCAAGFGVCCVISSSTCGSIISTNITYLKNPGYPSSYTPSTTGTCTFTINKVSSDICQLRLDYDSFSGFDTTTPVGTCSDSLEVKGQTGKNPPSICGTNTGYHMYAEFGTSDTDTVSVTITYASTTSAKKFNVLTRQISCTATWKAPEDCVQYFTGASGSVQSYNFQGGQLLTQQQYTNCIRTERGYCGILWKESSSTSPDPFQMSANPSTVAGTGTPTACPNSFIYIPNLSPDGIKGLPVPVSTSEFYSTLCGALIGHDATSVSLALATVQQPFIVGVYTGPAALTAPTTGFNIDYTQTPCT